MLENVVSLRAQEKEETDIEHTMSQMGELNKFRLQALCLLESNALGLLMDQAHGICQNEKEEMFMLGQEVQVKGGGRKAPALKKNPGRKANVIDRKSIIATGPQLSKGSYCDHRCNSENLSSDAKTLAEKHTGCAKGLHHHAYGAHNRDATHICLLNENE
ncbi:Complement C4-A [Manis pentadactyla]|nr:Complement C4-A [Manis pentadactyla]